MTDLATMSWVIGICNPLSALLVGPALAFFVLRNRIRWLLWCVAVGWAILLTGQAMFWIFGFRSGYPGFIFAQPWMIPISLANLAAWLVMGAHLRRGRARQVDEPSKLG